MAKNTATLYHDIVFPTPKTALKSSAMVPQCYVCQQGLENKVTLSARNIGSTVLFFCDLHYPKSEKLIPKSRH